MKKILTLSLLASLTLGAAAAPSDYSTTTPSTTMMIVTPSGNRYHTTEAIFIDTANTREELSAPATSPTEGQTLDQIKGDPDGYQNRDLDKEIKRTYNQRENIESDYGNEIEDEIIEDRDGSNR
jgi:hypothetical protein